MSEEQIRIRIMTKTLDLRFEKKETYGLNQKEIVQPGIERHQLERKEFIKIQKENVVGEKRNWSCSFIDPYRRELMLEVKEGYSLCLSLHHSK